MNDITVQLVLATVEHALRTGLDEAGKDQMRALLAELDETDLLRIEHVLVDVSDLCYSERRAAERRADRTARVATLSDEQLLALRGPGSFAGPHLVGLDGGVPAATERSAS